MIKEDFYTGQPVMDDKNLVDVQTVDQKNMMRQFSTDPNERMSQFNLNQQPQQQQPFNPFQPTNGYGGYAGNPVFQTGPGYGYNPYGGFGYGGFYGGMYNQPFTQFNNAYAGYQPRIQDQTVHVPGLNFGSDVLLMADAQEICEQLQLDMMVEQEEAIAKRNQRFQGYFNNNGYNYYGMPYYSSYQDVSVTRKYTDKINQMRQEAKQRRTDFNKRLSKMCHNYMGDNVTDDEIDMIYDGYDYVVPANTIRVENDCSRFARMVPVTNQPMYAKNYQDLQNFYKCICTENNMQGFFQSLGVVKVCDDLEEEMHRRRDCSQLYNSDSYKHYLRKHIMERNGIDPNTTNSQNNNLNPNLFPTLSSTSKLLDDGTLSITTPPWIGGSGAFKRIQLNNEMEQHFEENRRAFLESIYAQGK